MGKKKKGSFYGDRDFDKMYGINVSGMKSANINHIDDQYFINGDFDSDVENKRTHALNNNYLVQSTLDHAIESGNKKAMKARDSGDPEAIHKFMHKTHTNRMENGGKYSNHNDINGVNKYWKDKAASKQSESIADGSPEADQEPFTPQEKSDEHVAAEADYGDGSFPESNSAADSYNTAFNNATEAGRDMTAGDLMRQTSDDKMDWVTNRFMPYVSGQNKLGRHEQHHAASNAIGRAAHAGMEPPSLSDPMDSYNKYKDDLDSIG